MNTNLVAFYFAKVKKLFFFYGKENGLANQCQVFPDVPASAIHETLNAVMRVDLKWLLLVTSPQSATGRFDMSGIRGPGNQFAFLCDANTLPKPTGGS